MGHPALDLSSKTAVVIGGTSGIGLALATGLSLAGANVVPTSRRLDRVEAAVTKITKAGGKSLAVASDVNDRSSLEALLDATCAEFGKVDILVNCAGTTKRTPTIDVSEEEWSSIIETNLTGIFRASQVFGRKMLERKHGRIINIAAVFPLQHLSSKNL